MKELVRQFGVELEYFLEGTGTPLQQGEAALQAVGLEAKRESYNHRRREHWKLIQDSSVQDSYGNEGGEAVSPVLRGEDGLAELVKAANALRDAGFETNKTCGTHVHFGVHGYGQGASLSTNQQKSKEIKVIGSFLKNWMVLERALDAYQVPHRRANGSNSYARSVALPHSATYFSPEYVEEKWQQIDAGLGDTPTVGSLQNLWEGTFGWNNIYKVNPSPMWSHDRPHRTVEVRHLHGTLNAEKIVNWIRLLNDIWIAAAADKVPDMLYVPRENLLSYTFDYLETDPEVREYVTGQCEILGALNASTGQCGECGRPVNNCRCNREACVNCGDNHTNCTCCQTCSRYETDCVCCPNCGGNTEDGDCECQRCVNCSGIVTNGYEDYQCTNENGDQHDEVTCEGCCGIDHNEEDEDD